MKSSTGKLLNTVNKIGSTLLSNQNSGDPAIVLKTETVHIQVEKIPKETLIGHTLSMNTTDNDYNSIETSLKFPSVLNALDENMSDLGLQV